MKRQSWSWLIVGALGLAVSSLCANAEEEYVLDHFEVLSVAVSPGSSFLIGKFSTENTDFGKLKKEKQRETAAMMKRAAPSAFTESLRTRLEEAGLFEEVEVHDGGVLPETAFLLEGKFTVLNPGNRSKRYWAMGAAGKSKICIVGRVLDAEGAELIAFDDCRTGIGLWTYGGNAAGLMMADVDHTAEALVQNLAKWIGGELPVTVAGDQPVETSRK